MDKRLQQETASYIKKKDGRTWRSSSLTAYLQQSPEVVQSVHRKGGIRIQLSSPYPIVLFTKLMSRKLDWIPCRSHLLTVALGSLSYQA